MAGLLHLLTANMMAGTLRRSARPFLPPWHDVLGTFPRCTHFWASNAALLPLAKNMAGKQGPADR